MGIIGKAKIILCVTEYVALMFISFYEGGGLLSLNTKQNTNFCYSIYVSILTRLNRQMFADVLLILMWVVSEKEKSFPSNLISITIYLRQLNLIYHYYLKKML